MKANGTIIAQAYGYAGLSSYTSYDAAYAGSASQTQRYAYFLNFKTPEFTGVSESLTFSILMQAGLPGEGCTVNLRYAICTSDANSSSYMGTTGAVEDVNQLTAGTVSVTEVTTATQSKDIVVPTGRVASDTVYYLVLWSVDNTGVSIRAVTSDWGDHTVVLEYHSGLVYIDDGEGFNPHEVFIDNGESWDRYIVCVDNGTDWDQCG